MAACGGQAGPTDTTGPPTPSAEAVTVQPWQYRDDIVANRLQLRVTNDSSRQLPLASVHLRWSGMDSAPTPSDAVIGVGQRVDLPVDLGTPTCHIDGTTIGASPTAADATVLLTLVDGATEVARVRDPDGTLGALHASACERTMVGRQISLEFVDFALRRIDGRDVTVAVLRLQRRAAQGDVQVVSSGNTIPFNLMVGAGNPTPLLTLRAAATEVDASVQFLEARCDAHAVAEAKQPFRFVMQVRLDDDQPRPYVVEPPSDMHGAMLDTAAEGCAVLGEGGSLGNSG